MEIDNGSLSSLRKEYSSRTLDISHVDKDPLKQFIKWFAEAVEVVTQEPNVMTLATANNNGVPSARIVLLKGLEEKGFVFFTNYASKKGHDLNENPHAALVFYWYELERQVRVEGIISKISEKESAQYFQSRPKGSQIGAHASNQSSKIESREVLEEKVQELSAKYSEEAILPKPENWGGYCLVPTSIEFWQGRPNRLHDRIRYDKKGKDWKIFRLSP